MRAFFVNYLVLENKNLFYQCFLPVLTYDVETWTHGPMLKFKIAQRAMVRAKDLNQKLVMRRRTKVIDLAQPKLKKQTPVVGAKAFGAAKSWSGDSVG